MPAQPDRRVAPVWSRRGRPQAAQGAAPPLRCGPPGALRPL